MLQLTVKKKKTTDWKIIPSVELKINWSIKLAICKLCIFLPELSLLRRLPCSVSRPEISAALLNPFGDTLNSEAVGQAKHEDVSQLLINSQDFPFTKRIVFGIAITSYSGSLFCFCVSDGFSLGFRRGDN